MVATKIQRWISFRRPNTPTLQAAATAMCKPIIFRPSLKKKGKNIGRSLRTIWKLCSISFLLLHNVEYSFSGLQYLKKEQFWDIDRVSNFLLHHLPFFSHPFHFSSLSSFFSSFAFVVVKWSRMWELCNETRFHWLNWNLQVKFTNLYFACILIHL